MLKLILVNFQGYIKLVAEKYNLFSNAHIEVFCFFFMTDLLNIIFYNLVYTYSAIGSSSVVYIFHKGIIS